MRRPLCLYASDARGPSVPNRGAPRACAKGKGVDGTVYTLADCRRCELWAARDPLAVAAPVASASCCGPPPPPDDCSHFRELSGADRQARGLAHGKRWGLCLHAAKPLGEVVCPCRGCGPKCSGYPAA
jgi:hypothetical protein